jgi:hypothetical protein
MIRFAFLLVLPVSVLAQPSTGINLTLTEIDRGHSWVSPYWGYNTPKIVCDGQSYYTAGLWGATPEEAEGVVYKFEDGAWRPGKRLEGIYQPATLLLDEYNRLIVVYTRKDKPFVLLRGKRSRQIDEFETLPAPPDMPNAYYIGMAIHEGVLSLAYIVEPTYSMYYTQLDLETMEWLPSIVLQEGQVKRKPKTAWTYPILKPDATGTHIVASNCPDGGEGNTYNEVHYVYLWRDSPRRPVRELVARAPVGHNAYALDMHVDRMRSVHVVYMWNRHVYGEPLPAGRPSAGTYHSVRDGLSRQWRRMRLAPVCIAGFHQAGLTVQVVTQEGGALMRRDWDLGTQTWVNPAELLAAGAAPTGPGFMDVITTSSGSPFDTPLALVSGGLMPEAPDTPRERVLWSLVPTGTP